MTDTERLNLPDGGWWEIRSVVTRGMRKRFNKAALAMLPPGLQLDNADPEELKRAALADIGKMNISSLEDVWLLEGTAAYSYGDVVTQEAIDNLPDEIVQKVIERMTVLYGGQSISEADHKAFLETR